MCALNSANRDADVFAKPDDWTSRIRTGYVAFGFGIHQCLGQGLARMGMQVAFKTLFTRIPDLKIAIPLAEVQSNT